MGYSLPDKIKLRLVHHGVPSHVVVESWQVVLGERRWKLPLVVNETSLQELAATIVREMKDGGTNHDAASDRSA